MAHVNQVCSSILDNVINSGLDFSIHQTPYSIHFSLRKKFSKNPSNKIPLNSPSSNTSQSQETIVDRFRQELLFTRNEYVKLYNLYTAGLEAKCKLEEEHKEVIANLASEEQNVANVKAIRKENKSLKEKLENTSFEHRQIKTDLENIHKDKNVLSVALKASKADIKEQRKEFDKKSSELERKVVELSDFKKMKLAEEREEKLKKRKELKKANQKLKKEQEKDISKEEDSNKNELNLNPISESRDLDKGTMEDSRTRDVLEEKPDVNHNARADEKVEQNEDLANSGEPNVVDENDVTFIGPRLPRRMTKEEIEEFRKELLGKYFPT